MNYKSKYLKYKLKYLLLKYKKKHGGLNTIPVLNNNFEYFIEKYLLNNIEYIKNLFNKKPEERNLLPVDEDELNKGTDEIFKNMEIEEEKSYESDDNYRTAKLPFKTPPKPFSERQEEIIPVLNLDE